MRPRRVRLGCIDRILDGLPFAGAFNEAEARAPRMQPPGWPAPSHRVPFNEAEARAPRMHRGASDADPPHRGPSMRPRRVRLGCQFSGDRRSVREMPSMRPRRVRLGCRVEQYETEDWRKSFNEAEARAPRMHRSPACSGQTSSPFNEAEARAPRMRRDRNLPLAIAAQPSMRPRRVRLGCPDGAERAGPGDGNPSMRPRRVRLGCSRLRPGRYRGEHPSMRPRRVRLGCPPTYNPLLLKAISPCFREIAFSGDQTLSHHTCRRVHHVKEPYDSNILKRFERRRACSRH